MADKERESIEDQEDQDDSPEPRKAKGKALPRSEADLNALSEVKEADIRKARDDWKKRTIPEFSGLIEATLEPEGED